jgi:hypothetical protein
VSACESPWRRDKNKSTDKLQSWTNKDNNFDISGTTEFFGNLTSDSNSECQKTSENMSFIIFPQVVKVANKFVGHLGTF